MQYDNNTVGDRISIILSHVDHATDTESRARLLDDLELAVEAVLAEHGIHDSRIKLIGGHTYTSIPSDCPECGDQLQLIEPTLDSSNGAVATASCPCGWYGDAVYRLIDVRDPLSTDSERSATSSYETEESSRVRKSDIQPEQYPY